jgi:DNA polymerase I-like protein with 3'-5' exonuclease and polymerase domains
VENKEQAEDAATIMRNALPAKIPFKVDVEIGKSWGHSMGFEKVEAVPA